MLVDFDLSGLQKINLFPGGNIIMDYGLSKKTP